MADREDVMRKVRAMLDKAASTTFDGERDSFLKKANDMMTAYTIESWELEMAKPAGTREKPELKDYEYGHTGDHEIDQTLYEIFYRLADLCRVKVGLLSYQHAKVVGYGSDLEYLDLLFTNIRLHMAVNMVPHADPSLSYLENLAVLKEAGYKWQKVYELMVIVHPDHFPQGSVPKGYETGQDLISHNGSHFKPTMLRAIGVRFTKEYTDFCKSQNRERIYTNPDIYKRSFLQGYVQRLSSRINELKEDAGAGTALVLRGREDDLMEKLYEMFPNLRPHEADCDCDSCHLARPHDRSKCSREVCKRYTADMRKPLRYRSVHEKAIDRGAVGRGRAAANTADLMGSRNNIGTRKVLDR